LFYFFLGSSRGSVVVMLLAFVIILIRNGSKVGLWIMISISIVGISSLSRALNTSVFQRSLESIASGESSGRNVHWSHAINEFSKSPLFGGRIELNGIYPHNIFLEVLMSTGLIGFIGFSFLIFLGWGLIIRITRTSPHYLWIYLSFIVGFVMHFFSSSLYQSVLLFFPLGIIFNLEINRNLIDKKI
jgi:O-antigen ligase